MSDSPSRLVESCLAKPDVHQQWKLRFRVPENGRFFELAFDYIADVLNAPDNSLILDAGCGSGDHAIRLANRGFVVRAVDFSEGMLREAAASVRARGLEEKISIQREDILSLSFEDASFDYILCWGVLMHIPDLEQAISELDRVLKLGGAIVIGENNMHSLQSIVLRGLRRLRRARRKGTDGLEDRPDDVRETPSGIEHWTASPAGTLLTRQANIPCLIGQFQARGFVVRTRVARQFSELYVRVSSSRLRSLIHTLNNLWFAYVQWPQPAFGNLLILEKRSRPLQH